MNTKVLIGVFAMATLTAIGQATPARAFTYLDPATNSSTSTGYDNTDPYITLTGVTYGAGSGNGSFQEYQNVTYAGQYTGVTLGLWQDSEPGTTTFDFWANSGNNVVASLRIGNNDYLGIVTRQYKTQGNTTEAFQWAQIDSTAWYSQTPTVIAANDPATYLLWITTPVTNQTLGTSSDPPADNLNTELTKQSGVTTQSDTGVPAPLPFMALPVLFGFLPKLQRARTLQKSGTIA